MEHTRAKVLFLCTGNACRSQMAEGWARHLRGDVIDAYSAGTFPAGVSERAIQVMAEAGVDISNHRSKHLAEYIGQDFDYVVTLCDSARELCPMFPGGAQMIHQPFDDPAGAFGEYDQVLRVFRQVRDQIRRFIEPMPENLPALVVQA